MHYLLAKLLATLCQRIVPSALLPAAPSLLQMAKKQLLKV
jgi:hypothetical protein